MRDLIGLAFEHVEQLKFLYNNEIKHIEKEAANGMKKNEFARKVDAYLWVLLNEDDEYKQSDQFKSFERYIKKYIEIDENSSESESSSITFKVNDDAKEEFGKTALNIKLSSREHKSYYYMERNFNEQTIIMLMVKFENIMSEIFGYMFRRFPQKYLYKETITYSDILSIGEGDIRKYIINCLVDNTMRKSVDEWIKLFNSHKINLTNYQDVLDKYYELHNRRNIIVHNASRVNNTYLKGIENTNLSKPKIGDRLIVNREYVLDAFNTIECFLFAIFIECCKFQDKDNQDDYIEEIFNMGFEFLYNKEYDISEFVFSSLEKCKIPENFMLMSIVNKWIAQIEKRGLEYVESEIKEFDLSAKDIKFRIAKEALLENYKTVSEELEKAFPHEINADAVLEWPLFLHYRESAEFVDFKSKHPDEFNTQQIVPGKEKDEDLAN